MIVGIVAIAKNFAIGKHGKLPWHYSPDLKFFRRTTSGNAVVMGRKTYASIGKPLTNRLNIVMSRDKVIEDDRIITLRNKAAVSEMSGYLKGDVFIIGGEEIYREFSDVIEKWIVTEIPETVVEADAFLPGDFLKDFEFTEQIGLEGDLKVRIYTRIVNP